MKNNGVQKKTETSYEPTPRDFCLSGLYSKNVKGDDYHAFRLMKQAYLHDRGHLRGFKQSWKDRCIIDSIHATFVIIAVKY